MSIATSVAIFQDDQILLTKREDFEVWCLPGGGVEDNESLAQAAIREAKEETGLDVQLTRLVGTYSRSFGASVIHSILFAATAIGGTLSPQPDEVIDMRFFKRDEVADLLLIADHAQRIADAFAGIGGSTAWWHDTPPFPDHVDSRQELYSMRDQSDQSRSEFYLTHFSQIKVGDGTLEVGYKKTDDQ